MLADHLIPPQVIATKNLSSNKTWNVGGKRSLVHNSWIIATADFQKKLDVNRTISFDAPVAFGGKRLSDRAFLSDNLVKKKIVLYGLTRGWSGNGPLSSNVIYQTATRFDWIVRHKDDIGLDHLSELDNGVFEDYLDSIAEFEVVNLVSWKDRVNHLFLRDREKKWELFTTINGHFDWKRLAEVMGVSMSSIVTSSEFRNYICDKILEAEISLEIKEKLLAQMRPRDKNTNDGAATNDFFYNGTDLLEDGETEDFRSRSSLRNHVEVWIALKSLSSETDEGDVLTFDPFAIFSADDHIEQRSDREGRTSTLLPSDLYRIMELASQWVLDYGSYITSLYEIHINSKGVHSREKHRLENEITIIPPNGIPKISLSWSPGKKKKIEGEKIYLGDAVKYLITSAAILISSFLGRREGEVSSAQVGCISEDKNGLLEISLYIEKTLRDFDKIPAPQMLRNVVDILERVSKHTRDITGKPWIFKVTSGITLPCSYVSTRFGRNINEFLDACRITPPDGADRWSVAMHQLRRGHGVWFYHGLQGASLDALSRLFRHNDARMTRLYINLVLPGMINRLSEEISAHRARMQSELTAGERKWFREQLALRSELRMRAKEFDHVRCDDFARKHLEIWLGREKPIGKGVGSLYNNLDAVIGKTRAIVSIGSRVNNPDIMHKTALALFRDLAQTNFLEPVIGCNVHCNAQPGNPDHLTIAHCLVLKRVSSKPWTAAVISEVDLIPDHDFATDPICLECPFCVTFNKGQAEIESHVEYLDLKAEGANIPSIKKDALRRLQQYKQTVREARLAAENAQAARPIGSNE